MLVFVTTAEHAHTHEQVVQAATDPEIRVISYETLLAQRLPAHATYVFIDMDRLSSLTCYALHAASADCERAAWLR
jgi:hypothetical protein